MVQAFGAGRNSVYKTDFKGFGVAHKVWGAAMKVNSTYTGGKLDYTLSS